MKTRLARKQTRRQAGQAKVFHFHAPDYTSGASDAWSYGETMPRRGPVLDNVLELLGFFPHLEIRPAVY
jgi:hypothetical protein